MKRFRTTTFIAIVFFVLLAILYWYGKDLNAAEEVHIHAAFHVYRDNALVDFSGDQYMHIEPCSDEENHEELTKEEEQEERAHLHDGVGDVVHVHRKNARWKDLFQNLEYDLDGSVVGYVNGERIFNILNKKIEADDRALFLLGDTTDIDKKIESVPTVERIRDVEAQAENC